MSLKKKNLKWYSLILKMIATGVKEDSVDIDHDMFCPWPSNPNDMSRPSADWHQADYLWPPTDCGPVDPLIYL